MANLKVLDMTGAEVGTIELADSVFAVAVNAAVLHAAVRAYLLNQRQVHSLHSPEQKFPAVAESPGDRRVQVEQDRVPHVLLSGHTVVWLSVRSPEITAPV